jgi:hypothetical protein
MFYSTEQKAFMVQSYFRDDRTMVGPIPIGPFSQIVDYRQFWECLDRTVKLFWQIRRTRRKGSVGNN